MRHIWAVLTLLVAAGGVAAQDRTVPSRSDAKLREAEENYRRGMQAADGVGGPKDYMAAAEYYRKAAESGYLPAQYNLAYLYENGLGVKQDFAQAAGWYRKAADQGDPESQNNLGVLYSTGQGVPHNDTEAVRLYRLAAAQDDLEGATNLASMYLQGRGAARDTGQAFQLFLKAAARGYSVAQNNLALMYANGETGKRDYVKAWAWLDLAAAGIPKAAAVRDDLAREMTPAQLTEARQFAAQKRKEFAGKEGRLP